MKRCLLCMVIFIIIICLTGCSYELNQTQTFSSNGSTARVDLGDTSTSKKSISLPDGYPSGIVPIGPGTITKASRTGSSPNFGYIVSFTSSQEPAKMVSFYQNKLNSSAGFKTCSENGMQSMSGAMGGYDITILVVPSKVQKCDVAISLTPVK